MAKPAQRRKSPSARTPHEPSPRTPRFGKLEVCHSQSPPSAPLSRAPLGGSGLGDRPGLGGISGGGSVHGDTGRRDSGGAPSGHRSILPPPAVRRSSSGSGGAPPANERARRTSFTAAAAHNFDAAAAQAAAASAEAQEAAAAEAAANAETQLPGCDVEMGGVSSSAAEAAAEESPEEQTQPDARAGLNAAAEAAEAAAAEAAANAEAETQLAPPEEDEAPRALRPAPAVVRPPPHRSRASELRRSETVAGVEDFMRSLTPDAPELRCTKAVGPTGGPSQLRPGCSVALRTTHCPIPSPSPSPKPKPNS